MKTEKIHFKPGIKWYELLHSPKNLPNPVPPHEAKSAFDRATRIYNNYVDQQPPTMQQELLKTGTFTDKFTAMKVQCEEQPLLSLSILKQLNDLMTGKPRIMLKAMQVAVDIYTLFLLPDRALLSFSQQPLRGATQTHLLLFYFEDQLKTHYAQFISSCERASRSQQSFVRDPAIRKIGDLLRQKPEGERACLRILVNKFGDPLKAIASVATQTLQKVLNQHPAMAGAVEQAIRAELPHYQEASRKRALKFLGQLRPQADPNLINCENDFYLFSYAISCSIFE